MYEVRPIVHEQALDDQKHRIDCFLFSLEACRLRERQLCLYSFLSRSEGLDHAEGAFTRFMVASGGVLSEVYGHDGPGVCLGDGQTEAEGLPSQCGCGDSLLRRTPPYLTLT